MRFRKLDATFGALERRSLAFSPGLNIIEAPNESGKSTLAAFLRTMLYGLPTRERGALADKKRFLPWSGAPMQGTLELSTEEFGEVTLRRDTQRADIPMGHFTATYSGTGDEVPGLSGADCGERLLGVPREVCERSAFIRQSGLAVDPDAELERRIAALITTGEEGASYSKASAALKKQLNLRKANSRSGQIPTLERELEEGSAALAELRTLQAERGEAENAIAALREREASLREAIAAHELADRQDRYAAREQAKRAADSAAREVRVFRRMLSDSHIPEREVLEENRSRLRSIEALERQQREADARRQRSEQALNHFNANMRRIFLRPIAAAWLILLILCAALPPLALLLPLPVAPAVLYACAAAVVLFAVLFTLEALRARSARLQHEKERAELESALREAEGACAALKTTSQETLERIFEDIPAGDRTGAANYIHESLARRDMLAQLEAEALRCRQVYESSPRPDLTGVPARPVERPAKSREELLSELKRTTEARAEEQSRADYTAGRLRAIGDADALERSMAEKRERLAEAQSDYAAIALAMETLEHANTVLQSRFSPQLGKRAAAYFSALTGGKYDAVELSRTFHALASEAGESVAHDAALLSQGARDQLYLAVRLAICDMVLPEETCVPLVLDDALVSFDDERCAAALELLIQEAERRQILLLTCQHREAALLTGRENVCILSLTPTKE